MTARLGSGRPSIRDQRISNGGLPWTVHLKVADVSIRSIRRSGEMTTEGAAVSERWEGVKKYKSKYGPNQD